MNHDTPPVLYVDEGCVAINATKILHDVSIKLDSSDLVTVIGSNGAGKSTLLRTISGFHRMDKGKVLFHGDDISKLAPEKIVKRGILHVPEGRHVFAHLSVGDNLDLGSYLQYKSSSTQYRRNLTFVYQLFPILQGRRKQLAGTLSGGEQQMLAIGRALMANPRLIMLDEPSLGLAPLIIEEVFRILTKLNKEGLPMLLIEQNAKLALEVAKMGYVMERGRIVLHGDTKDLRENNLVVESYLGKQENWTDFNKGRNPS